jgi:RNA polymerase sigma-70 factor (ECF subfamily)
MAKRPSLLAKLSLLSPVLPGDEDQVLMARVAQDDLAAYRRLYERYKRPIMSYVSQMVRNRAAAEELTQEVFLKVYRNRANYEAQAKVTSWLWTIARNQALDFLRKKGEQLVEDEATLDRAAESTVTATPDAEQLLIDQSTRAGIEKCLDELPLKQKEAVSLRLFSELAYEEIAESLAVSVAATKSLLHRAKEHLIACLRRGGHHGGP